MYGLSCGSALASAVLLVLIWLSTLGHESSYMYMYYNLFVIAILKYGDCGNNVRHACAVRHVRRTDRHDNRKVSRDPAGGTACTRLVKKHLRDIRCLPTKAYSDIQMCTRTCCRCRQTDEQMDIHVDRDHAQQMRNAVLPSVHYIYYIAYAPLSSVTVHC